MHSRPKLGAMPPPSDPVLWAGGSIMLWLLYAFVFTQTISEPLTAALVAAGANVLPLAATHALPKAQIMTRTVPVQLVSHAGLAIAVATTWYALVLVFLASFDGLRGHGFIVSGFSGPAFTWKVY